MEMDANEMGNVVIYIELGDGLHSVLQEVQPQDTITPLESENLTDISYSQAENVDIQVQQNLTDLCNIAALATEDDQVPESLENPPSQSLQEVCEAFGLPQDFPQEEKEDLTFVSHEGPPENPKESQPEEGCSKAQDLPKLRKKRGLKARQSPKRKQNPPRKKQKSVLLDSEDNVSSDDSDEMADPSSKVKRLKSESEALKLKLKVTNQVARRKLGKARDLQNHYDALRAQLQLESQGFFVFKSEPSRRLLKVIRTKFDNDEAPTVNLT